MMKKGLAKGIVIGGVALLAIMTIVDLVPQGRIKQPLGKAPVERIKQPLG